MKVSENFSIQELVPPEIFQKFGINSQWFIDPKVVDILELLKEVLSAQYKTNIIVKVNDWHTGGSYKYSGYRPPNIDNEIGGATLSQHKLGNAVDVKAILNGNNLPIKDIFNIVQSNKVAFLAAGLTTIEDITYTKTWLHLDTRWTDKNDLLIVKP